MAKKSNRGRKVQVMWESTVAGKGHGRTHLATCWHTQLGAFIARNSAYGENFRYRVEGRTKWVSVSKVRA